MRPVPADAHDRLDPAALRAAVTADLLPFCTVTTLGTTATGAVDPLEPVTALCRRTGMWHHADGAWGGLGATVAVRGRTVLRACLCNYRTTTDDLDLLIGEVLHAADADEPPRPR
nr:pyridoxal-dependent decarboxylase [Streptomyces vietnamensis]